jgi:GNAT superfamily N-acetyltransferase
MGEGIRFAKKQDIPALCEIWKQCFSDSQEYIQLFYNKNFERIKILAYFVNEKPVSMLHLVDASFENKAEHQRARLIYATGTLPEYRKKGYMGELIKAATKEAKNEGTALFLKPSNSSLLSYYDKFGFVTAFSFKTVEIIPKEKQELSFFELSDDEYNKMREEAFSDVPHVKWDNAHIKWCIEENEYFLGKTLGVKIDNKDYFLMAYPENNTLVINETNLCVNQLKAIGACLCEAFNTDMICAYMPESLCDEGEKTISNLIYNSKISNPYINMIMI